MDAIGFASALISLVEATAADISYLKVIKNAPAEREQLLRELTGLNIFFGSAQRACRRSIWAGQSLVVDNRTRAERSRRTLQSARQFSQRSGRKLGPEKLGTLTQKLTERFLWKFSKEDIEGTVQKPTPMLWSTRIAQSSIQVEHDVAQVEKGISRFNERMVTLEVDVKKRHSRLCSQKYLFVAWSTLPMVPGIECITLKGRSGVGKTVLAQSSQSVYHTIAVLFKRLLHEIGYIPGHVRHLYDLHFPLDTTPSLETLRVHFLRELQRFGHVFIIVDALDEFKEGDLLVETPRSIGDCTSLLVTARDIPSIHASSSVMFQCDTRSIAPRLFPAFDTLPICATNDDIRAYLIIFT
ncbi:hypothetical protein DFS33DRAFT_1273726 [Desarmillaria ectypa]|nr:hypothetical protein DFS33DRAFT_1273726 [Desarmillaria ectypa]